MPKSITNTFATFVAALAVMFGAALTAYAYDNLEIEIEILTDSAEVTVEYVEDGATTTEMYTYSTTTLDAIYDYLATDLAITAEEAEGAMTKITEDDDPRDRPAPNDEDEEEEEEEEEEGDEEEEEDEDEDEEEEEGDDSDFCERTSQAAGWGVAKKCVNDDDYELNDKMVEKVERFQDRNMEKYQDYGKTTDRTELQSQLRELLLVLIDLLQQQMALQEGT